MLSNEVVPDKTVPMSSTVGLPAFKFQTSSTAEELTIRKIEILVSQAKIGTVSALSICALYALILVPTVGWPAYLTWYAVVAAGYFGRQLFYPVLQRRSSSPIHTLNTMAGINGFTGFLAVACLPLFCRSLNLHDLSVISAMVVGWTAISVSVLSVRPRIYLVFVVASFSSVLYAWSAQVEPGSLVILGVGLVFGGGLLFNVAMMMDRQHMADLEHKKAITDSLTQLPNREGLRADGDALLSQGNSPMVIILDLDRFSAINDALGYEFGDAVLIEAGRRLSSLTGVKVGRLHASQYCIVTTRSDGFQQLIASIQEMFSLPLVVLGESVDVSFTMGIAMAPSHGQNMQRLIRAAAIASRSAQQMKEGWKTFSENLESSRSANLNLLSTLKDAVLHDQLELFLQPKISLLDGTVTSAESLLRWRHPTRGLVPPSEFIPFAEQTGSIRMLTEWVVKKALAFVAEREAAGDPMLISVNISTYDLRDDRLATRARQWAKECGARPQDIRMEVTESGVMDDPQMALSQLNSLREAGFSLSIDDFGTGYSSLAYLQQMPVQELKIDRAFVSGVKEGTPAEVLLDSISTLAHRLNLKVVAEGVETLDEWNLVKKLGCDYVQGWYVAKAMPVPEFLEWRQKRQVSDSESMV